MNYPDIETKDRAYITMLEAGIPEKRAKQLVRKYPIKFFNNWFEWK